MDHTNVPRLRTQLKGVFEESELYRGEKCPLVLTAKEETGTSVDRLVELVTSKRPQLHHLLKTHGALLIRGFGITKPSEFEQVALAFQPELNTEYLGTSPRRLQPDCKYVFSASEFPSYIAIPQHLEISFNGEDAPKIIAFCCISEPTIGGQTPLADFQKVYDEIDEDIRTKWEKKGLRYLRSYGCGGWRDRINPFAVKRWDEVFNTTDKSKVASLCDKAGYTHQWTADGRLLLEHTECVSKPHYETGVMTWYNHAHIFDHRMTKREFARVRSLIAHRAWDTPLPSWYFYLLQLFTTLVIFLQMTFMPTRHLPTHVEFADGDQIPESEIEHVRDVMWRNRRYFHYQQGDVMLIDNRAVSHGRMPYAGPRKVVVAWF